jgi:hypothetical protein
MTLDVCLSSDKTAQNKILVSLSALVKSKKRTHTESNIRPILNDLFIYLRNLIYLFSQSLMLIYLISQNLISGFIIILTLPINYEIRPKS